MNAIAMIGDEILAAQKRLGLQNPNNFTPGLSQAEFRNISEFAALEPDNELQRLFKWRNGAVTEERIPMMHLWLIPGFYLLPVRNVIHLNAYLSKSVSGWSTHWFPLTSSGSADCHFIDTMRVSQGRFQVFYNDPEATPTTTIMYDSIESMFDTILKCYEQGAYFVDSNGCLECNYEEVFAVARRRNPGSDYWLSKML